MTIVLIALLLFVPVASARTKECVILLHGLARTENSMNKLARALDAAGYHTVNQPYESTQHRIADLAAAAIPEALARCPRHAKVHFVTHSLGGILVRQHLRVDTIEDLGRVVMLGPPNKGSEVVDKLHRVPGFKLINGPAGMQLGTGVLSVPNNLGPAKFELGIIAGTRSINLMLSNLLPNPDDGKVSVASTKLEGMADHITLPVTHSFMMRNQKVIEQVLYFLENGFFEDTGSQ
ncbi:alpha/beta hydrolase [Exilibacterium tricleocarpae]|uniref:Alpha/beta hydrolase n=1 Tax=Exilibacterium tricleocarpae TaxID=2591008 RepID=A0A545T6C3_9GAMM|nr:alpha/beta hydrolase [Exilibacterium tricleocarpae]